MPIERSVVLAMGLLLVMEAGAAGPESCAQESKGASRADDRARLQGAWTITKVNINGKEVEEPGLSGATVTFQGNELTIASPHEPVERYAIGLESSAEPRAMTARRIEPAGGPSGWMVYELRGPTLRIARYESLAKRPKGVEPERGLIVLELARPDSLAKPAPTPQFFQRVLAHPNGCWFALFSPDGKTLATGGTDTLVRLWDVATLTPRKTFRGHKGGVISAAFSPDGKLLATGEFHGTVVVVDLEKNRILATLPAHTKPARAVAFSPDGKTLATCSEDQTIKLWDAANWELILALPEQAKGVKWVAFSPDGQTLGTVTGHFQPGELTLWDAKTGEPRRTIRPSFFLWMFVFSPDGQTLAYAGHGPGLHYYDMPAGLPRKVLPLRSMTRPMAYSPDGQLLAVGMSKTGVDVLDAATGRLRWKLTDVGPSLFRLAFSPDGKTLAIAAEDGTFTLQDLTRTPEASPPPVLLPREE